MTRRARTVFLGSGEFAVPVVAALAGHSAVELVAVLTAALRPVGRRQELQPTPVGRWAVEAGLPTLTPARLREPGAVAALAELRPDLLVLADYGQIVPPAVLAIPPRGALNLHPSLLPRHRGAAPIPAAILAGDTRTGVSLVLMDAGLDSGPIVAQRTVPLRGDMTAPELEAELAGEAADLLTSTLEPWLAGVIEPAAQPAEGVTMTRPLRRVDGALDARRAATHLERQVRAYQPWPGSFVETDAGRLIVWRARVADDGGPPGTIVAGAHGVPALATANGLLELLEVQPAGSRRMGGAELVRGRPGLVGSQVRPPANASDDG